MGYYRGAFPRGDFYRGARGDPGFFSFLGGLAKKALGFIPGIGPIASAAAEAIIPSGVKKVGSAIVKKGVEVVAAHPVLSAAGAAGIAGTAAGALAGKHMGSPGAAGMAHVGRGIGGGFRRRRRMHPTNVKALRRALRRAYAFERLAMKVIHLTHPKKKGRFGGFKRPRKRKGV